jgi:DNA-binding response OmpR family regulator
MSKTIMIVDDEKRLVSLVESYLTQEGYRAVTAHNGKEALAVARREKPDLIVLDVMMPEMDGYEFMRKHRAENNTPIILLTARVDDEEQVIGLERGGRLHHQAIPPRELSTQRLLYAPGIGPEKVTRADIIWYDRRTVKWQSNS